MTQSQNKPLSSDDKIINLAAAGAAIQAAESLIPLPVPGVKPGLANVATLSAIEGMNFADAFLVALCRPVAASFLTGTFLSPAFIISFAASPASFLAMSLAARAGVFSTYGVSMAGAVAHNAAQLAAVYFLFAGALNIFRLLPLLVIAGAVSGVLTGAVAAAVFSRSRDGEPAEARGTPSEAAAAPPVSWRRLAAALTIVAVSFFVDRWDALAAAGALFVPAVFIGGGIGLSRRYARFAPAAAVFFALPYLLGSGLSVALTSGLRIILVFQASAWLFKKNPAGSLPEIKNRAFAIFPLSAFARAWRITGRAISLAPDVASALAAGDSGPDKEGFFRRAAKILSVGR
ncbi:MAG: hypothetical protein CVU77_07955 [Elusimicrobia bacterium HGW-Elusimicrobia-1]|jgi:heptaprenyl diphosphate synthase|nr:MAG: hypothetical protein CVU77_07955 [Elusimicrobia bacterium HGW-Elusimicrobia-1]